MKFLSIYKAAERNSPPSQEEMSKMGQLIEEGRKTGYLLGTEGCLPSAFGARVRRSGGAAHVVVRPNPAFLPSHARSGRGNIRPSMADAVVLLCMRVPPSPSAQGYPQGSNARMRP